MAKSIPEVKIGNEVYQIKDRTAREHLVEVSETQPESEDNKLWINNQEEEYEVPTIGEFNDLKSALYFNPQMEKGALVSGNNSANDSAVRSKDYVFAPAGTKISATKYNNKSYNITVCQYDKDKVFRTGKNITLTAGSSATTEDGTEYVRYFFWAVPALCDAVTDALLEAFSATIEVNIPEAVEINRGLIDAIVVRVGTAESDIDTLEAITTENYSALINGTSVVSDLNNVNSNIAYRFNYALNATSIPSHTPYGSSWKSERIVYFISVVKTEGAHNAGDMQIFVGSDGIYERDYGSSWRDWTLVSDKTPTVTTLYSPLINGTSVLSDLDDIVSNIAYRMNFAQGATTIPSNTPYGSSWKSGCVVFFQSIVKAEGTHSAGDQQIFIGSDGVYTRFYGASWSDWYHIADKDPNRGATITVDANGGGDYTNLCEALKEATENHTNAYVYVKRGTYDAITEMKAIHGNDYFDNLPSGMTSGMVYLKNGVKVYCEPGTKMTCNYTGNTENVNIYFAPINCDASDCTLENLTIEASNVRYCIHDDQWDKTSPYKRLFKNLTLIIDNTNNENWDRRQAFGGGLGVNGYIEFDDCYFKAEGLDGSAYTGYASCSYHNSPSEGAQSKIVINNCYFADNSTFALTYYGQSTLITQAFVSGCSLGHAMQTGAESHLAHIDNVEIVDCNNVIRS